MNSDNISRFVSTGSVFDEEEKTYRKFSFGPALLTMMLGIVPAGVLKGYWPFMTIAMILISIACIVTTFKLSEYGLTVQDSLCLDVVIFGSWTLILSFIEIMYFTIWKGFTPWFLLIYAPIIFIPLFVGMKIRQALKKENYNPKKMAKSGIGSVGFASGILGMCFAAAFRNVEQSTAFIVGLLCLSILNGFMSLGLLSLQKLYYMKKFKVNM